MAETQRLISTAICSRSNRSPRINRRSRIHHRKSAPEHRRGVVEHPYKTASPRTSAPTSSTVSDAIAAPLTRADRTARGAWSARDRERGDRHILDSPTSADWRGSGRGVPDDNDDVNELDGNPPPGMPPDSVIVCRPVSEIRGRLRVAELADDGAETPGGNTCEFKPPEGRTVSSDPIVSWLARDGYML